MALEAVLATSSCSRCGRPLKDPRSRAMGMGPICAARARSDMAMRETAATNVAITVNGRPLRHVVRHSPTGMEWGYGGSGPADLARSILLDYLSRCGADVRVRAMPGARPGKRGRERLVDHLYQAFKWEFVAAWPHEGWKLTGEEIAAWLMQSGLFDAVPALPVVYEGRRSA